ncbi:hypothetical protein D3C79_337620 [compost metagenome]
MATKNPYPLKKYSQVIRLPGELFDDDKPKVAWWYHGVFKNSSKDSQPHVKIIFRELTNGMLGDYFSQREVPITWLGQIRIGSVWEKNVSHYEMIFEQAEFIVDFSFGKYRNNSFSYAKSLNIPPPFPPETYKLGYQPDSNWMIEFGLPSTGKLVVPCLEFFSRCYGRSSEIKRVLTTYAWDVPNGAKDRFYAPLNEPEVSGVWKVKLRRRFINSDVVFLAHLKYDKKHAQKQAKSIFSTLDVAHHNKKDSSKLGPHFLRINTWFQEKTKMIVRGIPFDDGKSFLALHVVGCGEPGGLDIERSRENANNPLTKGTDLAPTAYSGAPVKHLITPPSIVDLTGDIDPQHAVSAIELHDEDFIITGKPRYVIDVRNKESQYSAGVRGGGLDATNYSTGEPIGSNGSTGYASIHAGQILETHGILRDMWNAVKFLKQRHSQRIKSVTWYCADHTFSHHDEFSLIPAREFPHSEDIETSIRNWVYINSLKTQVRGFLVIKIVIDSISIFIVEIQRKLRKTKDKHGNTYQAEEPFQGLVFKLKNESDLDEWLGDLFSNIRHAEGVFKKISGTCPGMADTFSHAESKNEEVTCENTVLLALRKLNINL